MCVSVLGAELRQSGEEKGLASSPAAEERNALDNSSLGWAEAIQKFQ
jgi:hypothetical protein